MINLTHLLINLFYFFVIINFFYLFMPGQPILVKWNWSAGPEKSEPLCLSTADTDILFDHFNLFILIFIFKKIPVLQTGVVTHRQWSDILMDKKSKLWNIIARLSPLSQLNNKIGTGIQDISDLV